MLAESFKKSLTYFFLYPGRTCLKPQLTFRSSEDSAHFFARLA